MKEMCYQVKRMKSYLKTITMGMRNKLTPRKKLYRDLQFIEILAE